MTDKGKERVMSERFEVAKSIVGIARIMPDDLPDGMADEIQEEWLIFKDTDKTNDDKENLAVGIEEICHDWGFPFS